MKQDALTSLRKNGRSIILVGLAVAATAIVQKACEHQTGDFLLRVHPLPLEVGGRRGFIAKGNRENIVTQYDTLWLAPKKYNKAIKHVP